MWKYRYERDIDMAYLASMFDEAYQDGLMRCLAQRPSRVDYLVKRWPGATHQHRERLFYAILCGAPIRECLEWGVKYDEFEYDAVNDRDLSEYNFPYLDAKGEADFMSWEEYDVWLKAQKEKEGDFVEALAPLIVFNEHDMIVYSRVLTWGDWNKEGYVAD